jgi:hypothetical protein
LQNQPTDQYPFYRAHPQKALRGYKASWSQKRPKCLQHNRRKLLWLAALRKDDGAVAGLFRISSSLRREAAQRERSPIDQEKSGRVKPFVNHWQRSMPTSGDTSTLRRGSAHPSLLPMRRPTQRPHLSQLRDLGPLV